MRSSSNPLALPAALMSPAPFRGLAAFSGGAWVLLVRWAVIAAVAAALVDAAHGQTPTGSEKKTVKLGAKATLVMETRPFAARQHKLTYCERKVVCLVDGYPVFGTEGAVPRREVTRLALILEGRRIPLEHRGMFNPWSPVEGEDLRVRIVEDTPNGLRVRGAFSDGSAAYLAEWLVIRGASARVLIDCVECVAAGHPRSMDPEPK